MANHRSLIAGVLIVIGIIALAVGIIYLTVEAHSLPSVLGTVHGYTGHRTKRGIAALIVGGLLVLVGGGIALYRPRPRA